MILAIMFGLGMAMSSCRSKPECEKYNFSDVIVRNNTGVGIVVDVTYPPSEMNEERYVSPGSSTTYRRMDAGRLWVWGSAGYGWSRNNINTRACENFTFTWNALKDGTVEIDLNYNGFIEEIEFEVKK